MLSRRDKCYRISFCLLTAVFLVYLPVVHFDFVLYDDTAYVSDNDIVKGGLNIAGIIWAFTTFHVSNWHPLTWLSHMLDVEIYGMHPGGHHFTSVGLHLINTLVLFFVLGKSTGRVWTSAVVSALFALHPLHIESVAWIAERKDVLSTLFFMLSLRAYVQYSEHPSLRRYLEVVLLFAFGLMSKPMLVTFPFVLLLMDYWPLGRIRTNADGRHDRLVGTGIPVSRLLIEKIPLFFLSAISCVVTFIAQKTGGSVASTDTLSVGVRIWNSFISYGDYLFKTIWPTRLSVYYPYPEVLPYRQITLSIVVLSVTSTLAVYWLKKRPWFAVGWFWYIGTLVPVIGFIQVGTQAMADRYTYIPSIGIFIIAAWWGREIFTRLDLKKTGLIIAGGFLCVLAFVSRAQVGIWESSATLFEHAVLVTKRNYVAHHSLGMAMVEKQNFERAAEEYRTAIMIKPEFSAGHNSIGTVQARMGNYKEAEKSFLNAINIDKKNAKAHNNLGKLALRNGKIDEAMRYFSKSLIWDPSAGSTYTNMGMARLRQGKTTEAIENFRRALEINPENTVARFNLGKTLAIHREITDSVEFLRFSLRNYSSGSGCDEFADLMKAKHKLDKAIAKYRKALSTQPGYVANHLKLDNLPEVGAVSIQFHRMIDDVKHGRINCPE